MTSLAHTVGSIPRLLPRVNSFMAESTPRRIDVGELIQRLRAEVAQSPEWQSVDRANESGATRPGGMSDLQENLALCSDLTLDKLAPVELANLVERAHGATYVDPRVPRFLRRPVRKQGRYNSLLLEIVSKLVQWNETLFNSARRQSAALLSFGRDLERSDDQISGLRRQFKRLYRRTNDLQTQLEHLRSRMDEAARVASRQITESGLLREQHAADRAFFQSELYLLSRQLSRSAVTRPANTPACRAGPASEHFLDAFYVAFEDRFRGSRELIEGRVGLYVKDVLEAGLGATDSSIVDLGCGRGEWIETAIAAGLTAEGVDANAIMVRRCHERSLPVIEADALTYLRSLGSASRGVITAFHLIEHLKFAELMDLFHEMFRVLQPGGLVILETPNPDNLLVASNRFYTDPTHQHPLPKEFTQFMVEFVGFKTPTIRLLHPDVAGLRADGLPAELRKLLETHLFGEQDYAVLARA